MAIPAAPTLSSPAAAATGIGLAPKYVWAASSGATAYNLQVSLVADFSALFAGLQTAALGVPFYPPLPAAGRVYWRVSAQNSDGVSAWSSAYFDTADPDLGFPKITDHVARGKGLILHQFQENFG